jgi:hypothetical protein
MQHVQRVLRDGAQEIAQHRGFGFVQFDDDVDLRGRLLFEPP